MEFRDYSTIHAIDVSYEIYWVLLTVVPITRLS